MNKDLKIIMMNMLGGADSFIREYGDEEVLMPWLMCGVPDGATEDDLDFISDSFEDFVEVMECFCRRVRQIMEYEEE